MIQKDINEEHDRPVLILYSHSDHDADISALNFSRCHINTTSVATNETFLKQEGLLLFTVPQTVNNSEQQTNYFTNP